MKRFQGQSLNELRFLEHLIVTISRTREIDAICETVCAEVCRVNPGTVCAVSLYDDDEDRVRLVAIDGLNSRQRSAMVEFGGGSFRSMQFPSFLDGPDADNASDGYFHEISGGLTRLMGGTYGKDISREIQKNLGVERICRVGLEIENKPFGGIILMLPPSAEIQYRRAIEALASHLSVIIHQRRAEAALRKSEETYRTIVSSMSDIIFVLDERDCFSSAHIPENAALYVARDEIIGSHISTVMPEHVAEKYIDAAVDVRRFGESRRMEYSLVVDTVSRWFAAKLDLHEDGISIVADIREITQRRETEAALQQSMKLDALGHLSGGVAHDFNNILNGVINAADLLLDEDLPPAEKRDYLELIRESSARASDLTEKLLLFARKGSGTSKTAHLHDILRTAAGILRRTVDKRISVSTDFTATNDVVMGDISGLQNVFINLGVNAADAMPDGGEMTITTADTVVDRSTTGCYSPNITPGEYVLAEVRDTGTGISPELQARIFEPFFTTKEPGRGTGLGLASVYGTLQSHDGAVTVESEQGKGTVFSVRLPVTEVEAEDRKRKMVPSATEKETVLIVDDEDANRDIGVAVLRKLGYDALTAANGREAISCLETENNCINLVLLDIVMPVMDGRECFELVRERWPNLPVVMMSGFAQQNEISGFETRGLAGFVSKPYNIRTLGCVLNDVLGRDFS